MASSLAVATSNLTFLAPAHLISVSKLDTFGEGCRLNTAQSWKWSWIFNATVILASSINSSTRELVSLSSFVARPVGSCVSLSTSNRTSGDARLRAPLPIRSCFKILARRLSPRRLSVISSLSFGSSILAWASAYVKAARDLMMLFANCFLTIWASCVISQMQENANLSSPPRSEHRLELSNSGTISIRLSTRYTVFPRSAASLSMAVLGRMKWETSAMCTPTSQLPLSSSR